MTKAPRREIPPGRFLSHHHRSHRQKATLYGGSCAASTEVVVLSCEQVHRPAAAGVKMGGVGVAVGVDHHQHPLSLHLPLEDILPVGEQHFPIVPLA